MSADPNVIPDADRGNGYPGGKGGAGVYQRIIRFMPPHEIYLEPFLGKSAVMANKRPAQGASVGIDLDKRVIAWWQRRQITKAPIVGLELVCGDALSVLPNQIALHGGAGEHVLIYADPEYLRSVTTRGAYAHPFGSERQHKLLLAMLQQLAGRGVKVMISGYYTPLYGAMLRGWFLHTYPAQTRGGKREECLWSSFPPPQVLHDARYAGKNFRERTRIKRKVARWRKKFAAMDPLERQAIREALIEIDGPAVGGSADRSVIPGAAVPDETNNGGGVARPIEPAPATLAPLFHNGVQIK